MPVTNTLCCNVWNLETITQYSGCGIEEVVGPPLCGSNRSHPSPPTPRGQRNPPKGHTRACDHSVCSLWQANLSFSSICWNHFFPIKSFQIIANKKCTGNKKLHAQHYIFLPHNGGHLPGMGATSTGKSHFNKGIFRPTTTHATGDRDMWEVH